MRKGAIQMYDTGRQTDLLYVRFHRSRPASGSVVSTIQADTVALWLLVSVFWGIVIYLALVQLN